MAVHVDEDLESVGAREGSALAQVVGLGHGWRDRARRAEGTVDRWRRLAVVALLVALVEAAALVHTLPQWWAW